MTDSQILEVWKKRKVRLTIKSEHIDEEGTGRGWQRGRPEEEEIAITLERPRRSWMSRNEPRPPWGLFVENELKGFRITSIIPDSIAVRAGLRLNDSIVSIGNESTLERTRASFAPKFSKNKIRLAIIRGATRAEGEALQVYSGPTRGNELENEKLEEGNIESEQDANPPPASTPPPADDAPPDQGPRGYLGDWKARSNEEIRKLLNAYY